MKLSIFFSASKPVNSLVCILNISSNTILSFTEKL